MDLSAGRHIVEVLFYERVKSDVLTVSEYAARLGRALREVGGALIEGEIQKVHATPRGMLFFDLTDGESLLSCKVFRRDAERLEHKPRHGDLVQVRVDRPDLFAERGALHLIVSQVSLAGEGELLRRRAQLLAVLAAEGLCDPARRLALPRFPRAVGVIAGQSSDGMSDVIRSLTDRWPAVHVVTCVSLVQGKAAPRQLIDALARLQDHPLVDVIIMARGGGSVQDLVCFDDERLCRALFACEVPVVCAIGHTDNNPVCNHVAWPAFTPSRSAELVVPSAAELRLGVGAASAQLRAVPRRLSDAAERMHTGVQLLDGPGLLALRAGRVRDCAAALARTGDQLSALAGQIREYGSGLRQGTRRQLADHTRDYGGAFTRLSGEARAGADRRESRIRELVQRECALLTVSVRRRLADARRDASHRAALIAAQDFRPRGWLLASRVGGEPARSAADLSAGSRIDLHLHDGRARALVEHVNLDPGSNTA